MRVLVVTGTGTGVGKTVTTAALAACALARGERVAVVKPIQTGVLPGEPGDLAEVGRLTGLTDLQEYVRYAEPLAPATAARRLGEPGPELAGLASRIGQLSDRDLVIVEGAGGTLVRYNETGDGIA
ncbi:MAG: dethiobiotin synthase, partial [Jatrophihabitantaceae bacterium]